MTRRHEHRRLELAIEALGVGVLTAAVVKELRKPSGDRTWHGALAGVVPYDLRPPSWTRFRSSVWSPDNPHVVVPRAFGVGWTINLAAVAKLVQRMRHAS